MKKAFLLFAILMVSFGVFSQAEITFKIENLSKPESLLKEATINEIYTDLILSDAGASLRFIEEKDKLTFPFGIVARSDSPSFLVNYGYHSFFDGMYRAYADHRPFVLSPDMIWLLISQGFAQHVNANPELLRHKFVDFEGKVSLVVTSNDVSLNNPDSPWEKLFPQFTEQIAQYTGNELIELLSADFSTTTPVERIASEITIMEAMKPYFEYIHFYAVCGIPEITLKGTPDDWRKILDRTRKLSKYGLEWWADELEPLLEEFVRASKGDVNKKFWRNMFKYHSRKRYGAPKEIDGWIVKFFPYDKDGKRNNLAKLVGRAEDNLPPEIVKVDLKHMEMLPNGAVNTVELELWAGFVGLEQNAETYALTPKIGWLIRKKDVDNVGLQQQFKSEGDGNWGEIAIRVDEIPKALLKIEKIRSLTIEFANKIVIPDELANVKIEMLNLSGSITKAEINRLKMLFPNTRMIINKKDINDKGDDYFY